MLFKILSAIALTPFLLSAQVPAKKKNKEEPVCSSPFHAMHVGVRHTEAKGVGYKDGYTTLEGFGIYDGWPSFMPFLDLRGHVFNNGKFAGNVGIGERTVMPSIDHIFGLYLYYDTRQSDHGLKVNQLSPGLELLGKRMEYRINTYFPFGKHKGHRYDGKFNSFSGHQILLQRKRKYAMSGGDAEIGAHITQSTRNDFYIGAGPYYFTSEPSSAWGGKARIYWRYKEYVSLQASYSYDHLFKNIVQGTATLSYPFGPKLKRKGEGCPNPEDLALSRAAFAPYRFEIPVIHKKKVKNAAINPATGQPWQVWFVNNTSSSNGTFESPFPTLVEAQNDSSANDMIYVFPGDGTSKGMDQGIILKDAQKLFGSGINQTIATTAGTIVIPAQSTSRPILTNLSGAGHVITLANGNEISGLDARASITLSTVVKGFGIDEIKDGFIHDNIISGAVDHFGIQIIGFGAFSFYNNTFIDAFAGTPFEAIRLIVDKTNTMTATAINNTIVGYSFGIGGNVFDSATGIFEFSNNNISKTEGGVGAGIFLGGGIEGTLIATVNNNQLSNLSFNGIQLGDSLFGLPKNVCVDIMDNVFNGSGSNGIEITTGLPFFASSASVNLINNQILNTAGGSFGVRASNSAISRMCLEMANNNATSGYSLTNAAGGTFDLALPVGNIGPLTQSGTINLVGGCLCP